jgi:UDP-glucose 4-epimerase
MGQQGFHIYNVGTGIETDVITLYLEISRALEIDVEPIHGPAASGEQRRSCISAERLEQALGVRMTTTLQDGLAETAEWFRRRAEASR